MITKNSTFKINVAEIFDDTIVSFDFKLTKGYKITGLNLSLSTEHDLKRYYENIFHWLSSIPEEIELQFVSQIEYNNQTKIDLQKNSLSLSNRKLEFLSKEMYRKFKEEDIRQIIQYLFITYTPKHKEPNWSITPYIFSGVYEDNLHNKLMDYKKKLDEVCDGLYQLTTMNIKVENLNNQQLFEYQHNYLNQNRSKYITPKIKNIHKDELETEEYLQFDYLKNITIRDQIINSSIDHKADHICIDGVYYKSINLTSLGNLWDISSTYQLLLSLPFDYYLQLGIKKPIQEKAIKRLNLQKWAQDMAIGIGSFHLPFWAADRDSILKAQHQKEQLNQATTVISYGQEQFFTITLSVIVNSDTLEQLDHKAKKVEVLFDRLQGAVAIADKFNHLDNCFSYLPNGYSLNRRQHGLTTSQLVRFLPLLSNWKGVKKPQFLLKNTNLEIVPFTLDKTDTVPVGSGLICGVPGSGKSVFVNWLVSRILLSSPNDFVVIVDIGGSYIKLARAFKELSNYLKISYQKKYAVNIFPNKTQFCSDPSFMVFIIHSIQLMVSNQSGTEFEAKEKHLIENTIRNIYKPLSDIDEPILSDLVKALQKSKSSLDDEEKDFLTNLIKNLSYYTDPKGNYAVLLNSKTQLDLNKQLTIFDLTDIKQDTKLQAIYLFLIQNFLNNRMLNQFGRKQHVFYDEAWLMMGISQSSDTLDKLFRTGRKYGTAITVVSQNAQDFLEPGAKQFIKQAFIKYILPLKDPEILEQFQFNEREIDYCKALRTVDKKFSQVFIKYSDQGSMIAQIELSAFELELFRTDTESKSDYEQILDSDTDIFEIVKAKVYAKANI